MNNVKTITIDENVIITQALCEMVEKYYCSTDIMMRNQESLIDLMDLLCNPAYFCSLDIDTDNVVKRYQDVVINGKFEVSDFEDNILFALHNIGDDETALLNAGKIFDMLDDKTYGYYDTGIIGVQHEDSYYNKLVNDRLYVYKNDYNALTNKYDELERFIAIAEKVNYNDAESNDIGISFDNNGIFSVGRYNKVIVSLDGIYFYQFIDNKVIITVSIRFSDIKSIACEKADTMFIITLKNDTVIKVAYCPND